MLDLTHSCKEEVKVTSCAKSSTQHRWSSKGVLQLYSSFPQVTPRLKVLVQNWREWGSDERMVLRKSANMTNMANMWTVQQLLDLTRSLEPNADISCESNAFHNFKHWQECWLLATLDVADAGRFYFIFPKDRSKLFETMGHTHPHTHKNNFVLGDDL